MPLESDRKDIFGNLIPSFGIEGLVDGLVSYVPGQGSAFDPKIQRQIIDATISAGLSGIPQGAINAPSAQYLLRNISIADGIQQDEINAVVGLLDNNLVTIDDVAAQTGIPAAEIQAVYNQVKGQPVVDPLDVLNDPTDVTAGLINLTIGSNQMLDPETLTAAQAAAQATAQSPSVSQDTDTTSEVDSSLDSTVAADPDLTGSVDQTIQDLEEESSAEYKVGDIVTDNRIVGDYEYIYDAENNVFHYVPFDFEGNRVYTGETIDANTVGGFDPTQANTGTTKAIIVDPVTGQPVVEHSGDGSTKTTDDTTDETGSNGSGLDITITGGGLVNDVINAVLTGAGAGAGAGDGNGTTTTAGSGAGSGAGAGAGAGGGAGSGAGAGNGSGVGDGNGSGAGNGAGTVINGADGADGKDGKDGQDGQDGADGRDGQDGRDGTDGKDGKDGKDGMIGLFSRVINETPLTESVLFQPQFTEIDNVQLGMFEQFLRAAGGRR